VSTLTAPVARRKPVRLKALRRRLHVARMELETVRGTWAEAMAQERLDRLEALLRDRERDQAAMRDPGGPRCIPVCLYCLGPMGDDPGSHHQRCAARSCSAR
jgi:hypothetical protein